MQGFLTKCRENGRLVHMENVVKMGCFSIVGVFAVFVMIRLVFFFFSEEENTPRRVEPSDTPRLNSAPKAVRPATEAPVRRLQTPLITTPHHINRVAKELDWFKTPQAQGLKVGDFIVVSGHPVGYIGCRNRSRRRRPLSSCRVSAF